MHLWCIVVFLIKGTIMSILIVLNFLAFLLNFIIWIKMGTDLNLLCSGVSLGVMVFLISVEDDIN